ncbi:S-layer homology domain-containing protein [Paenibacillus illinoisensis]|uniref:S-layer homology domain-containing protein n=1 Tax=Paenibacillus illinoisensis TaxID=59845 RepID=UPI000FD7B6E0|nr:S-layer homology domain-containing protein [Paenibacillus illinoisensis]
MKKNFKAKSLSILSTVAILSAMVPHASASVTLSDISSSYAKEEINELVQKGIIYGTGDGKFNPTSNIKRQDFAILLVRALNLDTDNPPQSPSFKDVPQNNYAFSAIEAAVKAGLIKGMGNGVFGINQNLTREQMAVIFVNALGVNSAGKGQNLAFSDVNSISDWAKDAVGAAVELELMKGNPDGTFKPYNQASRQEVALVAYKFLNEKTKIDEQKPSVTPPPTPIPQTPTPIPVPTPSTGGTPSTGTGGNSSNNGDLEIANLVKAAIAALPAKGDVMLTDKTAVEKARTEYGALTTAQKTMVGDITRLTEAEAAIAELEAQAAADLETANRVKAAIEGLPVKEDVELADKAAVEEARTKYEALTATQKALVGDITRLTEAEAAIVELEAQAAADLEAANLVKVAIEGLPVKEEVELADKTDVDQARTKYEALTATQKALVGDITRLTEAEAAIVELEAQAAADLEAANLVKVAIEGLPVKEDVVLTDKTAVDQARTKYEALTATQKALVGDITRLTEAEAAIVELEAQAAADLEAANLVKAAIEGLPVKEDVVLTDKTAVEEARTKYEALTATQKALVGDITRLTEAEAAIAQLEIQAAADLEAANLVKAAIEGLPVKENVELADKAEVEEARTKYESLTATQKALVGDITRLTEAEAAIADWQVIALAIENLKVTYNGVDVSVLLPNNQDGANVTWSLKDPTQSSIIDVLNGDIIRAGLTADTNIVLVATIISGSKSTNKEFVITVQAEVAEPKSILSKEITNFDFTNVYATQAREESNKIISTDFKTNPKHFTISDGNITIPVDLTWDIPLNGFSTGQVVGSAIDSFIQDYCNAHGINLGDRTVGGYGFEDTFFISTFKTGSSAAITLGGNDWSFFFQNNHWTGTDEDSTKNRTFVVSDGVNQASIVLRQKFTDMSNLVTYLNNQLQSASVSVTAEQVNESQFKLVSNSSNTDITITGNDKEQFFDN